MKQATLKQAGKVLKLMEETSLEQLQEFLGSGLLSDLLRANIDQIDRQEFRKLCGLKDLKIATASFDLENFLWKEVSEDRDERSVTLKEVDFANVRFVFSLNEDENCIRGKEKLHRLKTNNDIRLGATVFMGLWNDYLANEENSVLEYLRKKEIIGHYVDFFGTIFLYLVDYGVLYFYYTHATGKWNYAVHYLKYDWDSENLSAVLPQVS